MDFETSDRAREFADRLTSFMDERVLPAEPVWQQQVRESAARGQPHCHPPVMEELKEEARSRGLWNLFLPDPDHGPGLSNLEYAPLAEIMGRTRIASEACNCSAPDTGNMEVLHQFGSPEQKEQWLEPLLAGEIRSGFGMTEPDQASSDATNISMRIERDGDDYVLNGRKWWTTGALHPNARILIVMGKTDPDAHAYQQQSMVLVPLDSPGLTVLRSLPVFGYHDPEGHGELLFEDVRVPATNLLAGEGQGFMIGQARLGPGRIHHCMRAIGAAERALELLCDRADARETFGEPADQAGQHPRVDRREPHRPRDGAAAGAQDGLAHGHRGQPARAHGDRGDQGRGAADRPEDRRPRDPGARRRRGQRRLPARLHVRGAALAAAGRRARRGAQAVGGAPGAAPPAREAGRVSVDPTGADLKRFMQEDPGGPVVMLNLLRFAEGGRASYDEYARKIVPFIQRVEAEVLYFGDCSTVLVAPESHRWDAVLVVRYPSREAFSRMVADPEYQQITHLRSEGLEEAVLQATVPLA